MNSQHRIRCVRGNVALSAEMVKPNANRPEFGKLINLSGTGCLLETPEPMVVGDIVYLRFSIPGQTEVETTGRVARRESDQVGVQFDTLTEETSEKIVRHVVSTSARRR